MSMSNIAKAPTVSGMGKPTLNEVYTISCAGMSNLDEAFTISSIGMSNLHKAQTTGSMVAVLASGRSRGHFCFVSRKCLPCTRRIKIVTLGKYEVSRLS